MSSLDASSQSSTPAPPQLEALVWPQLKIARAEQHLKDLEARIRVWLAGKPFKMESRIIDDGLRWQSIMRVFTQPPLFEWALLIGDCFHALRASLDACVWELAHLNGAIPSRPHRLQFPILADESDWERVKREQLQTVPEEFADRIRAIQPFNRPADEVNRDPLFCLNRLDIIDKHRSSISLTFDWTRMQPRLHVKWDSPAATERNMPPRMIIHPPQLIDGMVVMELLSVDPIVEANGGLLLGVTFTVETPAGREEIFRLSNGLIGYIRQVENDLLADLSGQDSLTREGGEEIPWERIDIVQQGDVYRTFPETEPPTDLGETSLARLPNLSSR